MESHLRAVREWYGAYQKVTPRQVCRLLLWRRNILVAIEGFVLLLPNASSAIGV